MFQPSRTAQNELTVWCVDLHQANVLVLNPFKIMVSNGVMKSASQVASWTASPSIIGIQQIALWQSW